MTLRTGGKTPAGLDGLQDRVIQNGMTAALSNFSGTDGSRRIHDDIDPA